MTITALDPEALDTLLSSDDPRPLLLDFWSPGCAPCRAMTPTLERLADEAPDALTVAKINLDAHPELGQRFKVRAVPTLILLKAGRELSQRVGQQSREQLRRWLGEHQVGVDLPSTDSTGDEQVPLAGAFYGDPELRDFLLNRVFSAAAAQRIQISRFPYWTDEGATVSASFVKSADPQVFERVTGLPIGVGLCMEFASLTEFDDLQQVAALMPAGADLRSVPARTVRAWLADPAWVWPALIGTEADELRRAWLDACERTSRGTKPASSEWGALRDRADRLISRDPMRALPSSFASAVRALCPLPASAEAAPWGDATLMHGTYLAITKAQYDQGWRTPDFAVEGIVHQWLVAHCPNPREKTAEEMQALHERCEAEHAGLLAEHRPRQQRFHEGFAEFLAPWRLNLRQHLLVALREATRPEAG